MGTRSRSNPTALIAAGLVALLGTLGCRGSAPPAQALAEAKPAPSPAEAPTTPVDVVAMSDRDEADRALDEGRKPREMLAFLAVPPGARVAELMAGFGYTAELLARAVGPTGRVYAQNNKFVLERFAAGPFAERLAKPIMANVTRADRELEDPLPPDARDLDLVVMAFFYHDTVWQKVDRPAMNRAIFAALRPGGRYVVLDHSARAGDGLTVSETLHRIEESVVRAELEAAGFEFVRDAAFLRNPDDARDWSASPRAAAERRGTSDRFVLEFRRPTT